MIHTHSALEVVFFDSGITIKGNINRLLFKLKDVAAMIGVTRYDDAGKAMMEEGLAEFEPGSTNNTPPVYLTEMGMYLYLLRSKSPEAAPFVNWAMSTLIAARKKEIDAAKIALEIANNKIEGLTTYSTFAKEKLVDVRTELGAAKLIIKHCPTTEYVRSSIHSYHTMVEHAFNRWFVMQVKDNDVLYNRCDTPTELINKLYRMGEVYFDAERYGEYYVDMSMILCQHFGAKHNGAIIPPNQKLRVVPALQ